MPRFFGALPLGGVILLAGDSPDVMVRTYASRLRRSARAARVCLEDHECARVLRYLVLGPLFLPVYFIFGGISGRNLL